MRRSLAPSQITYKKSNSNKSDSSEQTKCDSNMTTIERLPLFGFLEIPENLNKQFKIPSGCSITKKNLELRKTKRLGMPKQFRIITPSDISKGSFKTALNNLSLDISKDDCIDEEENISESSIDNLPPFEPLILWTDENNSNNKIEVIPSLTSKLRPHQREGVQFLFECTMGLRSFSGQGCILADDMGLGKTLMSITTMWTLLHQGFQTNESAVKKVIIVCPTSLVGNWDNEIRKWVGDSCPTFAAKGDIKTMIRNYLTYKSKSILIVSYESQRQYSKLFEQAAKQNTKNTFNNSSNGSNNICDLLICDEAHKLKNSESGLSKSLNLLPAKKRILLSGTPMQNELTEFFNMVNFCNPLVLGTIQEFRKKYERPILAAREPDAHPLEIAEANKLQKELSKIVNEFILKRGNILNAKHLPPKLVQFVCCRLSPIQEALYQRLLSSKEIRHIKEGKQTNTLNVIRQLINVCSHPNLILESYKKKKENNEQIDDDLAALVQLIPQNIKSPAIQSLGKFGKPSSFNKVHQSTPEQLIDVSQSGKMNVLFRIMQTMRMVNKQERIVVVSNYTSTLDLIELMCKQSHWPVLRLDGTVSGNKRTKLVDEFNNPQSNAFAFLLSSKAGGCGINLIGGNRLVLFDPDWNPASDKQAAARIWREGQKRRCFIYRFMSTGTIEEKIIQRQLSKEGLSDIVDDKEQVNSFSTEELKQLFYYQSETFSSLHDSLQCKRCSFLGDHQKKTGAVKNNVWSFEKQCLVVDFLENMKKTLLQEHLTCVKREQLKSLDNPPSTIEKSQSFDFILELFESFKNEYLSFNSSYFLEEDTKEDTGDYNEKKKKTKQKKNSISLPLISKKQRDLFVSMENSIVEAKSFIASKKECNTDLLSDEEKEYFSYCIQISNLFPSHFSITKEYLTQWDEFILTLMKNPSDICNDPTDCMIRSETQCCVEQEGCPEESDFNKWSHHNSAVTCDDELFVKATQDLDIEKGSDEKELLPSVSFVFGLEVNFDLLQQREALLIELKNQKIDIEAEIISPIKSSNIIPIKIENPVSLQLQVDSIDENTNKTLSSKKRKVNSSETYDNSLEDEGENINPKKKPKKKVIVLPETNIESKAKSPILDLAILKTSDCFEIDEEFRTDWKKVRNMLNKYEVSSDPLTFKDKLTFSWLWKQLKTINNNWRVVIVHELNFELYTRTPGLNAKNFTKYLRNSEYFLSIEDLLQFIQTQLLFYQDEKYLPSLQYLLDNSKPIINNNQIENNVVNSGFGVENQEKENIINTSTIESTKPCSQGSLDSISEIVWACPMCTFENSGREKCEICCYKKPSKRSKIP